MGDLDRGGLVPVYTPDEIVFVLDEPLPEQVPAPDSVLIAEYHVPRPDGSVVIWEHWGPALDDVATGDEP